MTIFLKKFTTKAGGPGFIPASRHSESLCAQIKDGSVIKGLPTEQRNWRLHDRFFSVLSLVWENQEQFKTSDQLREATLIEIGYCELRERFDGSRYYVAASMASGRLLDGWTIERIYEASVREWVKHFGIDPTLFEQEARVSA